MNIILKGWIIVIVGLLMLISILYYLYSKDEGQTFIVEIKTIQVGAEVVREIDVRDVCAGFNHEDCEYKRVIYRDLIRRQMKE